MAMDLASIRKDFSKKELSLEACSDDAIVQMETWLTEAIDSAALEPTAFNLATVNQEGKPSSRIVLLKGFEQRKLEFFTNYSSRKGQEILLNQYVAATFFWAELERQIRVEGKIEKLSTEQSDRYFFSRPYSSRIGAWASPQSQEIDSKTELLKRAAMFGIKHPFKVPRPDFWGGYCITPERVEFWQGRPSRLHDRVLYVLQEDLSWKKTRLAP